MTFFLCKSSRSQAEWIFLNVGESIRLPSPPGETLTLSRSGIVQLYEEPRHVTLYGKSPGQVLLRQSLSTRLIKVFIDKSGYLQWMKVLEEDPWLKGRFVKDVFYITGSLYRFSVWKKLAQISKEWGIPYKMHARISEKVKPQAQKMFQSIYKRPFQIQWISPPVVQVSQGEKATELSHFGVSVHHDLKMHALAPLVEIQVLLVEFVNNKTFQYGGSFQNPFDFQTHGTSAKGQGRTLSQTTLVTQHLKPAQYLLGGQVPVHSFHPETGAKSIQWKNYGISLEITPQVDVLSHIQMDVLIDISEIDQVHSSEGSPAVKTHKFKSQVTVKNGQTLNLSRLDRKTSGSSSGFPLLISKLSAMLFPYKGSVREKTKALILITPKIIRR